MLNSFLLSLALLQGPQPVTAPPVLDGDTKVEAGEYGTLTLKNPPDAWIIWDIKPEPKTRQIKESPDGYTIYLTGKPGTEYNINCRLFYVENGKKKTLNLAWGLSIGPGAGPVPPGPGPVPPTPVTPLWGFVVIEESQDAISTRYQWVVDPNLKAYARQKNYGWRIVDKDNTTPELMPFIKGAKNLPYIYYLDLKKNIVAEESLPKTPADLLTKLKQIEGN